MDHLEKTQITNTPENAWADGRPWIIGKAAMSLNGKMTRPAGEGQWITGEAARRDVQFLRSRCDAILIGAQTARADNPRLTVRDLATDQQPWRIVLTRSNDLPDHLEILTDAHLKRTLILTPASWQELWDKLFDRGIRTLLVEGGGQILNQLAAEGWIDESILYYAPFNTEGDHLVSADTFRALPIDNPQTLSIDADLKISGRVLKSK